MSISAGEATIHDVAAEAGVSIKTVSRVVNGYPHVSAATRNKVQGAIDRLKYERNDLASSLRGGKRTQSLGLVVGDITSPFAAAVAAGVAEVADSNDQIVLIGSSSDSPETERRLVKSIVRRRIDGLLIVPTGADHDYLQSVAERIPVVAMDEVLNGVPSDSVVFDNANAAEAAISHLIGRRHQRIGLLAGPSAMYTNAERTRGYRTALESNGFPQANELQRLELNDANDAFVATRRLLNTADAPTAVLATNNQITVGAVRAAVEEGKSIEIIGFDDFDLSDLLPIHVTTLRNDGAELGRRAARMILERIEDPSLEPLQVTLPIEFSMRIARRPHG